MKRNLLLCVLCSFFLIFNACSGETEASKKANKIKADSMERQTQRALDSANEVLLKQINSVDDSNIVNDTAAPTKKED